MAGRIGKKMIVTDNIKVKIYFLAAILLIIFLQMRHINEMYGPWVNDDEIGYWGTAAFFTGYDWSGILKYSAYYSYGYGALLAPLFFIFKDPINLYRSAIVLNIFFLIIVFIIAYNIVREIYNQIEPTIAILLALIATLTSGAVTYAEIAWAETAILLFTWLIYFGFLKYIKRPTIIRLLLFAVSNLFIYVIHQRMIGLVIASIIIIIICALSKKIPLWHVACGLAIIICGFLLASIIKTNIQNILWDYGSNVSNISIQNVNDYEGQIGKILSIFSNKNDFLLFIESFLGKIFYFLFASMFTAFAGIFFLIKKIKERSVTNEALLFYFTTISVIGMIGIASIFNFNPDRNDGLLYGRYSESLVGIVILIALSNLLIQKQKKIIIISNLVLFLGVIIEIFLSYFIKYQMWDGEETVFTLMIPALSRYIIITEEQFYILKFTMESLVIVSIILLFVNLSYTKLMGKKAIMMLLCAATICFSYLNSNCVFKTYIEPWQSEKRDISRLIEANRSILDVKKIYFVIQDEYNSDRNRNMIQFVLRDKQIECIADSGLSELSENTVFIANTSNLLYEDLKQEYELIDENEIIGLFMVE